MPAPAKRKRKESADAGNKAESDFLSALPLLSFYFFFVWWAGKQIFCYRLVSRPLRLSLAATERASVDLSFSFGIFPVSFLVLKIPKEEKDKTTAGQGFADPHPTSDFPVFFLSLFTFLN